LHRPQKLAGESDLRLAPTLPALQNELASFLESLSAVERICRRSQKLGPVRTAGSRYWIVGGAMISLPLQAFLTQIPNSVHKKFCKRNSALCVLKTF
jgi:hypothetical protein